MALPKGTAPAHVKPVEFNHSAETHPIILIFRDIPDPRRPSINFKYSLVSILFMTLVSVICGAKDWAQVVVISNALKEWLGQFVDMKSGVPCESTFINVFNAIQSEAFEAAMIRLAEFIRQQTNREVVAFDGQTLRGTSSRSTGEKGLHLLHAWSVENGICLGQMGVDDKTNEITAMPKLMKLLDLKGTIVTADAMNTQKSIASEVIASKADYALPVKGNQPNLLNEIVGVFHILDEQRAQAHLLWERNCAKAKLHRDVERLSDLMEEGPKLPGVVITENEKGHGRLESRTYTFCPAEGNPACKEWKGAKTVGRVVRERTENGKTSTETVYFISSLSMEEWGLFHQAIRKHWHIENGLHWRLDVVFRQDNSRYRDRIGARNLAIVRKFALAALSQEATAKCSIASKQAAAACDPSYRLKVLNCFIKNVF